MTLPKYSAFSNGPLDKQIQATTAWAKSPEDEKFKSS